MFSFDVSAIDIVLVVAVVVLLSLFVTRKPHEPEVEKSRVESVVPRFQAHLEPVSNTPEPEKSVAESPYIEDLRPTFETPKSDNKPVKSQVQTDIQDCSHSFGYLRNRPKNTPVPEECLGCQKFTQCLFQSE